MFESQRYFILLLEMQHDVDKVPSSKLQGKNISNPNKPVLVIRVFRVEAGPITVVVVKVSVESGCLLRS